METRRGAIQIVINIWNCLVFEEVGDPTHMEEFRAALEKGPPAVRALLHGAIYVLKLRKRLRYPKTRLLVGKWELGDLGVLGARPACRSDGRTDAGSTSMASRLTRVPKGLPRRGREGG
ncbi:MAG TPA: hypothetical protein VLT61_00825 [Anaeromyxobacteraceae bacterium]|nr:hypothetical protein [Anaeromyxobacteraceae bacterium]